MSGSADAAQPIDDAALRGWPLPRPAGDADKEQRGRVLIVAGSAQLAGAARLAGDAALRAGAGKLVVATAASGAAALAAAVPEARVIPIDENGQGGWPTAALSVLEEVATASDAVLIGPGLRDAASTIAVVQTLLPWCGDAALILDALAMQIVEHVKRFERTPLLTPHAGEMAQLCAVDKGAILADPLGAARRAAARWNAVVALKGAGTVIALPDGRAWQHQSDNPGLGTSGSGDVLAGLAAGLAARGAPLHQAAAWAVALHARAGQRLARRRGPLGFMARELAAEVPRLMHELG